MVREEGPYAVPAIGEWRRDQGGLWRGAVTDRTGKGHTRLSCFSLIPCATDWIRSAWVLDHSLCYRLTITEVDIFS